MSRAPEPSGGWREEAIAALAGGLAHDLNNLLSATLMMVDLLADADLAADERPLLEQVGVTSRRAVGLVRQLLWLARGCEPAGRFQPRHLLMDLQRMLHATLPPAVTLRGDFPADLHLLAGEPFPLYALLLDLCRRTGAELASGGRFELRARNDRLDEVAAAQLEGAPGVSCLRIELEADGGEIPAPDAALLTRAGALAGLSAVGERRLLRIFLPAAIPPEDDAPANGVGSPGAGRTVLVAEGDEALRRSMVAVLKKASYQTLAAADGAEAIALFTQTLASVDAVVVGNRLDFLSPPALIRAVRRLREEVPVLAIDGGGEAVPAGNGSGVAGIARPFTGSQLLHGIDQALGSAAVAH